MKPAPHLLVDGMNVIGSRPDGWWRDRADAARRLLARLQALAGETGESVTLVLEGRRLVDVEEGRHDGVEVLYARRRGRDAGDDRIAEVVASAPDPATVQVVTSDRRLGERARDLGAGVVGAAALLDRLDGMRTSRSRPSGPGRFTPPEAKLPAGTPKMGPASGGAGYLRR